MNDIKNLGFVDIQESIRKMVFDTFLIPEEMLLIGPHTSNYFTERSEALFAEAVQKMQGRLLDDARPWLDALWPRAPNVVNPSKDDYKPSCRMCDGMGSRWSEARDEEIECRTCHGWGYTYGFPNKHRKEHRQKQKAKSCAKN